MSPQEGCGYHVGGAEGVSRPLLAGKSLYTLQRGQAEREVPRPQITEIYTFVLSNKHCDVSMLHLRGRFPRVMTSLLSAVDTKAPALLLGSFRCFSSTSATCDFSSKVLRKKIPQSFFVFVTDFFQFFRFVKLWKKQQSSGFVQGFRLLFDVSIIFLGIVISCFLLFSKSNICKV